MGIADPTELDFLDAPPQEAVDHAESLLDRLGANDAMAKRMSRYPLPPRLSRIVVESLERGVGEDGCVAAALLASGVEIAKNDLLAAMDASRDFRLKQHIEQLRRIARPEKQKRHNDDALLQSVLTGFPDRVARKRSGKQVLLSNGGSAEIAGEPPQYEFMVAVDAEDRKDKPLPLIRMTARIEPEWLIDLFPDRVRDVSGVVWNRTAERVDAVSSLRYDELMIEESRGALPDPELAANLLAERAIEAGIERFVNPEALEEFSARVYFAGLLALNTAEALRELCQGLRSFNELRKAADNFISLLEHKLGSRKLNDLAPEKILLPNGRQTKVHYERDKQPWISSRLQDFFGMKDTPRLGANRTPVVLHLLAPNHRPVQTTTDLAGFWERLYPQVRRELMRRYPKHAWPEKP
jgi:ATP-dependent helicase HrpB